MFLPVPIFIMQIWYWHENLVMSWKKVAFKMSSFQNNLWYIVIFYTVSLPFFLCCLCFIGVLLTKKAVPKCCWRTEFSPVCGSLYAQHNHKVLIVLENKAKQIPKLRGIFRLVGAQEVLNTSSRWGVVVQGIALVLIIIMVLRDWKCLAKTIKHMACIRALALCQMSAR